VPDEVHQRKDAEVLLSGGVGPVGDLVPQGDGGAQADGPDQQGLVLDGPESGLPAHREELEVDGVVEVGVEVAVEVEADVPEGLALVDGRAGEEERALEQRGHRVLGRAQL